MSVVSEFILRVEKVKQCSERCERFPFDSGEGKQRSEFSQRRKTGY